jgi:hypothetical protein
MIHKKIALAIAVLTLSASSFACTLRYVDDPSLRTVVDRNGGYSVTDEQCEFLSQHGLALFVSGHSSIFGNNAVSTAWAEVRLTNPETGIVSNVSSTYTAANTANPSKGMSDAMLYDAVRKATATLDFVTAAQQVEAFLKKGNDSASKNKRSLNVKTR